MKSRNSIFFVANIGPIDVAVENRG